MKVEEFLKILEKEVAPVKLSDDFCSRFGLYDNSGIIINCGNEVGGALFSLDLSEMAVRKAIDAGYNVIVTHHPAIYGGINKFDLMSKPQSRALSECLKQGISVISMHLNFDAAPRGIDYYLMRGLGGTDCVIRDTLEGGGYGRVFDISPVMIETYLNQRVKIVFSSQRVSFYGADGAMVKRVASFCGAGCDEKAIAFAKAHGADTFVSSDLKHHEIAELVDSGISVIQLTHYSAEAYGLSCIYESLKGKLGVPSSYFFDARLA